MMSEKYIATVCLWKNRRYFDAFGIWTEIQLFWAVANSSWHQQNNIAETDNAH